jgi:hypothetical protein
MVQGPSTIAEGAPLGVPTAAARAWAAFLGFCLAAAGNGVLVARNAPPWREGGAWLALWLDAVSFLGFGIIVALCVWLWARFGPSRQLWGFAAAAVAALGLGLYTLPEDLENFSGRQERFSPQLVLAGGIFLVSATLPAAAALGRWLSRSRVGSWLGVTAAVAGLLVNDRVLPADYFGIHFFIAWCSATLAGQSLVERPLPRIWRLHWRVARLPRAAKVGLSLLPALLLAELLVVSPPARAAVALTRSDGSAFHWLFSRLRAAGRRQFALLARREGPWFRARGDAPPVPPGAPALVPANAVVLLITIDAVRAELVNSGRFAAELPNLTRLRDESVWFSEARAAGTLTKVSLASLFFGTYFFQQYWTGSGAYAPREDMSPRFPDLLSQAGVRTISLRGITWLHNSNGVVRGFGEEHNVRARGHNYTPARPMLRALTRVLGELDERPTFVFLHLTDPHFPYAPRGETDFDRYFAEVAQVDAELGRLLEVLEQPALKARTVLVVSADHGEAFGEHRSRTHGTTLYDETLRVPLLVRLPDRRSRRVDKNVSLIDVGPSILDLMGVATPGHFMGESLVPFLRGQDPVLTRPLLAEARLMQAYVTPNGLKLIFDPRRDRIELYDLARDPGELENLADREELLEPLLAELMQLREVHRLRREGYEPPFVR